MACRKLPAEYYFQKRLYGIFLPKGKSDYRAKIDYPTLGCCGPTEQRAKDGTVSTMGYDDLQRVSFSTTAGVTTLYSYNVFGGHSSVTRKGSDNSELTTTYAYNEAGEQISSTDPLSRVSSTSESFQGAHRIVTSTRPDGGTQISEYLRDGTLLKVSGTAARPVSYEYGIENGELYTKVTPEGAPEQWVKSYSNFMGQSYKTVTSDGAQSVTVFDSLGRPVKSIDQTGRMVLTSYNAKGEADTRAIDMNGNGSIDYAGTDRISKQTNSVLTAHGTTVRRSQSAVYSIDNDGSTTVTLGTSDISADGLTQWSESFGRTSQSVTAYPGSGVMTVTSTFPDSSTKIDTGSVFNLSHIYFLQFSDFPAFFLSTWGADLRRRPHAHSLSLRR